MPTSCFVVTRSVVGLLEFARSKYLLIYHTNSSYANSLP